MSSIPHFSEKRLTEKQLLQNDFISDVTNELAKRQIVIQDTTVSRRTLKPRWLNQKKAYKYILEYGEFLDISLFSDSLGNLVRVSVEDVIVATVKKEAQLKYSASVLARMIYKAIKINDNEDETVGRKVSEADLSHIMDVAKVDNMDNEKLEHLTKGSGYHVILNVEGAFRSESGTWTSKNREVKTFKTLTEAQSEFDKMEDSDRIVKI